VLRRSYATSQRIRDGSDAGKRWRKLAGWIADGQGEGFASGFFFGPGAIEVKRGRLGFSTRGEPFFTTDLFLLPWIESAFDVAISDWREFAGCISRAAAKRQVFAQ